MGMYRMSGSGKLVRVSVHSLIAALSLSILTIALASACDFPPTFGDEYYDSTINYISGFPLAAPSVATNADGGTDLDLSGSWDWAWRGITGNSYEYMTLTDTGTVGTTITSGGFTLAADEDTWQLELVNLAGDPYFETDLVGATPDGWETAGTATATATLMAAGSPGKHGQYLSLASDDTDWAGLEPGFGGIILDSPDTSHTYQLTLFIPQSKVNYLIGPASDIDFSQAYSSLLVNARHTLEPFTIPAADTRIKFALNAGAQTVHVDDLRIVRLDLKALYGLRMYLAPADSSPGLVPGKYELSAWVRRSAGSLFYDDPDRETAPSYSAPFASKGVTLAMRQVGFIDNRLTPIQFQETFEVTDDWTRVALRMGDGNLARFDEASSDPVLELAIYPFDVDSIDAGSIELAGLSLRFFVDGYTN